MSKSKKIIIVLITIAAVAAIGIFLNSYGLLKSLNEPLNKLVAGVPEESCTVDSDCIARTSDCSICGNGDVVNKEWETFCPFHTIDKENVNCMTSGPMKAGCTQGQCTNKLAQETVNSFEDCEQAGYPVMESYPRQCRTSDGRLFVEIIPPVQNSGCGDGMCQDVTCLAIGCPPAETSESCPEDCTIAKTSGLNSSTTDWQTYRNEKYGFEFQYPTTWGHFGEKIIDPNLSFIQLTSPDLDGRRYNGIFISVVLVKDKDSIYAEPEFNGKKLTRMIKKEELSINTIKAIRIIKEEVEDPSAESFNYDVLPPFVYFETPNSEKISYILFRFTGKGTGYQDDLNTFEKILQTFKLF